MEVHLQGKRSFIAEIESNSAEILSKFRFDSNLKEVVFVEDTIVLAREPVGVKQTNKMNSTYELYEG